MKYKIIAETAFSHEGDFDYLIKQIEAAHNSKADIIKFQVFLSPETYYVPKHPALDTIGKYVFTASQWEEAFKFAHKLNLEVLALPLESQALDFCMQPQNGIQYIELHSVCLNEVPLLKKLYSWPGKVILGIGGYAQEEISFAIDHLDKSKTILMLGFQSFPTDKTQLNLSKIKQLQAVFNMPVGYADHTDHADASFHQVNQMALTLGAIYFEKHIVIEKGIKRIDFESAIEISDFYIMRESLNATVNILGTSDLNYLNEKEQAYQNRRKKLVALTDIQTGNVLSPDNLGYRISTEPSDLSPMIYSQILGKALKNDLKEGENVLKNHL